MMNLTAYEQLQAAEMPEAQARVVASHLTDSTQMATKEDVAALRQEMGEMRLAMEKMRREQKDEMGQLESRIIRWQFGSTLTLLAVLTALRLFGM